MYKMKPSYKNLIINNMISSSIFVSLFGVLCLIFKNYKLFLFLILTALSVSYFFFILIYNNFKFKNTDYLVKKSGILIKTGVFFISKRYIPINSIKYIEKTQGITQKISNTQNINLFSIGKPSILKNLEIHFVNILENKLLKGCKNEF